MKPYHQKILWLTSALVVSGLLLMLLAPAAQKKAQVQADEEYSLFLPLVLKNYPRISQFGVAADSFGTTIKNRAVAANVSWVRLLAVPWDLVQPNAQAVYDWSKVAETQLRNAGENGMTPIAVIQYAPGWAQKHPPMACGPIAEAALPAYGQFLTELVRRYSKPPYNVKYWELGNEPDLAWDLPGLTPRHIFGCWGESGDPYYGGGYYATMLKVAYPAIKAADPDAQVLIGGLLLDCDYTRDTSCKPSKFLDGILANGGGDYFDIVSYHAYPYFPQRTSPPYLLRDVQHPKWDHRGGAMLGKVDFLRWVMAQHNVTKPLFLSEAGFHCPEWNIYCNPSSPPAYFEAQADYVVWVYARAWANGFLGSTWYTLDGPGWRDGGLLDASQNPRPAYNVLQYMSGKLAQSDFRREVLDYSGVNIKTYEFTRPGGLIWVMWAQDEMDHLITLPANAQRVYNRTGVEQTLPLDKSFTVNHPIFVDLD